MKKALTLLLLFCCCTAFAQDSLQYYNQKRYTTTTSGMKVLGSWGIANVAVGATGWATTNGSTKYFYQMNTIWGAVNVGAAILGYTGAQKTKGDKLSAAESLTAQKKIERIFLINGVLDVAYVATGVYVNHRGNIKDDDKLKGYGSSVIMQGAFLLLFDSIMYGTHKSNGNKLRNFLAKNPVTFNGSSVGMLIKL
ncbi:DUF6992 family protein [Mucilaginibacter glaciei]|uniref:DUF5683 domain-containing protein n=1 Tax=Mucilaginibacter glaciei TaxID=2772109 RepID=A0A926NQI9_9SPHI|nr:hypothetical protein [Mucilaginibacter glaciei]MBD1392827.1 hypothetical protein [Mucilaginibacter glaciei]